MMATFLVDIFGEKIFSSIGIINLMNWSSSLQDSTNFFCELERSLYIYTIKFCYGVNILARGIFDISHDWVARIIRGTDT